MSMQQQIEEQVHQAFNPVYLKLDNESDRHAGPATESHFKLVLVSAVFDGLSRVKRHQAVYKVLAYQMTKVHALALHTHTPDEWQKNQSVPASPLCAGAK
ncbi:BolA/IbaG family iron-sulfur metabolism protein [Thiomicrospira sp. R3]|uniref:BolA family protein n=1 Tax=Thiomicrospira sp. R3 TaxID=3035472 RepID=UPI00259BF048|nr:BolA/IbaG family iron-sulfur metabolism protein [Thiomicrospira sp. R3]WFE68205.1 BolA/IbaG family iron-sulfur metabolism protein [Thiomicrospira sp. R3]